MWRGPFPDPGDGIQFITSRMSESSSKIYVVRDRVGRSKLDRSTIFRLWLIELGPNDDRPVKIYRCVRNVRNPPTGVR